jgi:large subunit ribosomal protein L13
MKTYSAKPTEVIRQWYLVDASDSVSLGRISTSIAGLLMGKGKPQFTSHIDCGDFVVVINAAKITVTGDKLNQKIYYSHSSYPGGLKETKLSAKLEKDPESVIVHAVRGMMPNNKLLDERLKRLKVYAGSEHKHDPQKPQPISLKDNK